MVPMRARMHVPRRALLPIACILLALGVSGADAGVRVQREVKSPDGRYTLQWLAASDGTCTGMRLVDGKTPVEGLVRYATSCSRITTPFSPDGRNVVFLADAEGPIHVVPTR